jgi:protein-S-isoprenylcysteine O-methyltransferase Ste14
MAASDPDRGPGIRVPPPVLVAALLALGWWLRRMAPWPLGPPLREVGLMLALIGGLLTAWALLRMYRVGTEPRPDRPDTALVAEGPFRFSRNPVYLGYMVIAVGLALVWADAWTWLAVVAASLVLDRWVIRREERYLPARFGPDYAAYAAQVRRWL